MDWRHLGPPDDIERDGLMGAAAKTLHFEVEVSRIKRVTQRGRWLRRSLKAKHALIPSLARKPVSLLTGFCRPLSRRPDRSTADAFS
jgi:hypothetical protein